MFAIIDEGWNTHILGQGKGQVRGKPRQHKGLGGATISDCSLEDSTFQESASDRRGQIVGNIQNFQLHGAIFAGPEYPWHREGHRSLHV